MNIAELISAKRDGKELSADEIRAIIIGYADDDVPDYQMSAFCMAVLFRGMTRDETVALTTAVIDSGERMSWSTRKPTGDKHSTGGIGDKVSIPLAPMLACCGMVVPMISGRGLGVTGGTLDKLESIKGYRCDLSADEFRSIVNWNGCSITGATANLAPADMKMYALRDVTGTIPSVPLITASILSKKVAEGIDSLVLDVKCGSGAFMKTIEDARELAKSLVSVGNQLGVKTTAVISDMNQPLGNMIGNAVEVDESVDLLTGDGPRDVTDLTLELGGRLLVTAGVQSTLGDARQALQKVIDTGEALEKLAEMVNSHGGDLHRKREVANRTSVPAVESGYVSRVNAERLGLAVIEMGGGRKELGDQIDHSVGIEFLVNLGDSIEQGQPIANVFCNDASATGYAANLIAMSIGVQPDAMQPLPLVIETF